MPHNATIPSERPSRTSPLRGSLSASVCVIALFILFVLFIGGGLLRIEPSASGAGGPDPVILYSSDDSTVLFENFEGVNLADTIAPQVGYAGGYLGGQALNLPDQTSFALYSDSWLVNNGGGFQSAGTIEFYFRPESFAFTAQRFHAMLVTQGERSQTPQPGQANFSIKDNFHLDWGIARLVNNTYDEVIDTGPRLFAGQWYHMAITWSPNAIRLYKNGEEFSLVDNRIKSVLVAPFFIGATGVAALTNGLAAIGRFDRFRLSKRARTGNEFPKALDVRIDSPTNTPDNLTPPFAVSYRAFSTDTSSKRVVDLYASAGDANVSDAFLLAKNLPESGTFLTGAGFQNAALPGAFFLLAVARTAADSAFFFTSQSMIIYPAGPQAGAGFDTPFFPADTTSVVAITPTVAVDTFTPIKLNGSGGTTPATGADSLFLAANESGANANYTHTSSLSSSGDSVKISIWTTDTSPSIYLSIRSDTTKLRASSLPTFMASSENAIIAFGATVFSLEFGTSNGLMIGDTISTSYIGDKFAYTLEFQLSQKTVARYRNIGFDTSPGSSSFGFWYANTYGDTWTFDPTVRINVAAGSAGGLLVRAVGITRDLPGGLGGVPGGVMITGQDGSGYCVIERMHPEKFGMESILSVLRTFRDSLMASTFWRLLVELYYAFCGLV